MRISDWSSDVCSSDLDRDLELAAPDVEIAIVFRVKQQRVEDRRQPWVARQWRMRTEERRAGQESVGRCRSRWPPQHKIKKQKHIRAVRRKPKTCSSQHSEKHSSQGNEKKRLNS